MQGRSFLRSLFNPYIYTWLCITDLLLRISALAQCDCNRRRHIYFLPVDVVHVNYSSGVLNRFSLLASFKEKGRESVY